MHASATRHAFGIQEIGHPRRYFGFKAASRNGQRERALGFFAGTYATRANDALARVKAKIGIGFVFNGLEVIFAIVTVAHFTQTHCTGHVLQFAIAIGGACQTIQGVIGNIQFHGATTNIGQLGRLRVHFDAVRNRRRARSGVTTATLNFHHAQSARAKWLQTIGRTQFRHVNTGHDGGPHDGCAFRHAYFPVIYGQGHLFIRQAGWRAVIQLVIVIGAAVFGLVGGVVFNVVHDALLYGFSQAKPWHP